METLSVLKKGARFVMACMLAGIMTAGLSPALAWGAPDAAASGVEGGVAADVRAIAPLSSSNVGAQDYSLGWDRWAEPVTSYLHEVSGGLQRVEYADGRLVVEDYDAERNVVASRTVDASTYRPTGAASVLWGGFFSGSTANFVVTGQSNPSEDDELPVVRITKYSKDWAYQGGLELAGINTYIPFDAGSLRMTEVGGKLYIRTAHEMYESSDGLHHQANMTFVINEADLSLDDWETDVWNISSPLGYVSHSFNQFVTTLDGSVYALDHGDAYPRSVVLKRLNGGYINVLDIWGTTGDNWTGVSVGGFTSSEASNTLLGVGNSVDQDAVTSSSDFSSFARNVWLSVTPSGLGSSRLVELTSYGTDSLTMASTPVIVKVDEDRFLVAWEVYERQAADQSFYPTGRFSYVFVDGDGKTIGRVRTETGALSDCQPIVVGGDIVWYVTGTYGAYGTVEPSAPAFYAIDASTGVLSVSNPLQAAEVTGVDDAYSYTGDPIEPVPTVVLDGSVLIAGVDYEVSYRDNVNAGQASVVVTGKGAHADLLITVPFTIEPARIVGVEVEMEDAYFYTGSPVEPKPSVSFGGKELGEGSDYLLSYEWNTDVGTARLRLDGIGNFAGTAYVDFRIAYEITADMVAPIPDQEWNGFAVTPDVTVVHDGRELSLSSDYTVSYLGNDRQGTAYAIVTGKGDYAGTVRVPFKVGGEVVYLDAGEWADGTSYAWATSYIARASEAGYVSGYEVPGGYEFRPRNHVTRAEVATILYRCTVADPTPSLDAGKFPDNTTLFSDNLGWQWYTAAVNWAASEGILQGSGGLVRPDDHVTRAELATIIGRWAESCFGEDVSTAGREAFESTEDWRDLGVLNVAWAEPYFVWTCDTGILSGSAGPTGLELKPNDYADRAQMAKIIVVAAETVGA
ncbi:S-layer homology domain-containing protein [Slackia piriformis]|nr:S-layer homology domain-containing protein [Slackia piriformis]